MFVSQLISLAITTSGDPADQIANLFTVFGLGQLMNTFTTKLEVTSIADWINIIGIFMVVVQFSTIMYLKLSGITDDQGQ